MSERAGGLSGGWRRYRRCRRRLLCEVRPLVLDQGEVEVPEMVLEGPAVVHLLAEGGACLAPLGDLHYMTELKNRADPAPGPTRRGRTIPLINSR